MLRMIIVRKEVAHDQDQEDLLGVEEELVSLHSQRLVLVHWLQRRFQIVLDPDLAVVTDDAEIARIRMIAAVLPLTVVTREARALQITPERALLLWESERRLELLMIMTADAQRWSRKPMSTDLLDEEEAPMTITMTDEARLEMLDMLETGVIHMENRATPIHAQV